MKLKVPFYKQSTKLNCGPTALKMILSYFGEDFEIEDLEKKTRIVEGKGIYTIQIAVASVLCGFKTEYFSKHVDYNPKHEKLDFYKKYSEMDELKSKNWIKQAKQVGVIINEKTLDLNEILSKISKDSLAIILVDWNIISDKEEKGYQGHFVPIVGYDKENVYVHNHGFDNPQSNLKIPKEIFNKARKAKGTDEDVVVIFRKPKPL